MVGESSHYLPCNWDCITKTMLAFESWTSEIPALQQSFLWGPGKQPCSSAFWEAPMLWAEGAGLAQWLKSAQQEEEQTTGQHRSWERPRSCLWHFCTRCQPLLPVNRRPNLSWLRGPSSAFQENPPSHPYIHCGLAVGLLPRDSFSEQLTSSFPGEGPDLFIFTLHL